jgi:hypothetical protein
MELHSAVDERLKNMGGYSIEEVERVLHLGLLCAYPDPRERPTIRQVLRVLDGANEGAESEGDATEAANLLDRIRTTAMWSSFNQNIGGRHPTFDEILRSVSRSATQSDSDVILAGR